MNLDDFLPWFWLPRECGGSGITWTPRSSIIRRGEARGDDQGPRAGHGPGTAEVFACATLTVEDDRQDYGEVRYITIGFLDEAMVVLVWTRRDDAHRIISRRRAHKRERRLYGPRF